MKDEELIEHLKYCIEGISLDNRQLREELDSCHREIKRLERITENRREPYKDMSYDDLCQLCDNQRQELYRFNKRFKAIKDGLKL